MTISALSKNNNKSEKHKTQTKKTSNLSAERSGSVLGITAKSTPPSKNAVCSCSADEIRLALRGQKARSDRWETQRSIANIFSIQGRKEKMEFPYNFHRTAQCKIANISNYVGVIHDNGLKTSYYSGIATCGSYWACPICSKVVSERKRRELSICMDGIYKNGLKTAMITLTIPHYAHDKLKDLMAKFNQAISDFRKGSWRNIANPIGYKGMAKSLEVTYGKNGWHIHTHELWAMLKDNPDEKGRSAIKKARKKIVRHWFRCCVKAGLVNPSNRLAVLRFYRRSVHIRDNASTSEYLAKQDSSRQWGADREMAKGAVKENKGLHPFQLAVDYAETEAKEEKKRLAGLFIEYAMHFKGKAGVFISAAFKKVAGVTDLKKAVEDMIKAENEEEGIVDDKELRLSMDKSAWKGIVKNNLRTELLDVSELNGVEGIEIMMNYWGIKIEEPPKSKSDIVDTVPIKV